MESGEEVPLMQEIFVESGEEVLLILDFFWGDGLKLCGIFVVLRSVGAHSSVG